MGKQLCHLVPISQLIVSAGVPRQRLIDILLQTGLKPIESDGDYYMNRIDAEWFRVFLLPKIKRRKMIAASKVAEIYKGGSKDYTELSKAEFDSWLRSMNFTKVVENWFKDHRSKVWN